MNTRNVISNVVYTLIVLLVVGVSTFMVYNTWTLGSDEDDYEIVCLGGHEYYRANFAAKMAVAPKLTSDGNPVGCK